MAKDISISGELLEELQDLAKTIKKNESDYQNALTALARAKATIEDSQKELEAARTDWDQKIQQVPEALRGLLEGTTVRQIVDKEIKVKAKTAKKGGGRWQPYSICKLIDANPNISKTELKEMLESEKPDASLDRLDDYLKEFTNNKADGLHLNVKGKAKAKELRGRAKASK